MLRVQKPQQFYEDAEKTINRIMKKHFYVHIGNNLQIPNDLRINDSKMKIWSQIISGQTFRINQIAPWRNEGTYQFHVFRATLVMINADGKQVLLPRTSWIVNEKAANSDIHIKNEYTHILIEYREPVNDAERPMEDESLLESQTVVFTPTVEDFKQKRSFIRAPLPIEEVRKLIRFIDCECTRSKRKERKTPLSVAILNYEGKEILNTLITPRNHIVDYGTKFHGITEKKARNQVDEYEIIKLIQSMTKGKIIIGHDLALELSSLLIPKYKLMGMRDLAGAKVFRSRSLMPKNNGQWYKLQTLAKEICGLEIQKGVHTALEDVEAIRKIYLAIEKDWVDDIVPIPQKINCSKISLQEYQSRQNQSQIDHEQEPDSKRIKTWTPTIDLDDEDMEPWDSSPDCQIMEEENIESNSENKLISIGIDTSDLCISGNTEIQTEAITEPKLLIMENDEYFDMFEQILTREVTEIQWKSKITDTDGLICMAHGETQTDTMDLHVMENISSQTQGINNVNLRTIDENDYLDVVELIFADKGSDRKHENQSIATQTDVLNDKKKPDIIMQKGERKDAMTTTSGWDPELDEVIADRIEIRGEEFLKMRTIIEYRSASGKIKSKTFDCR